MEADWEVREDVGEKGNRIGENEENETVVKRKCVNSVSMGLTFSAKGKFRSLIFVWCRLKL